MVKQVTTTKKVKEIINSNPGKSKKDLWELLGIKEDTFIYHYQKLLKAGEIEKIEDKIVMTEKVLKDLEYYFTHGFTDEEACLEANVNIRTFYEYCRQNQEWADRRQTLKKRQVMKAKLLVSKNLEEEKDDYIKMVFQEEKRQERARIKVDLGVTTEDEEEIQAKNVSLKVSIQLGAILTPELKVLHIKDGSLLDEDTLKEVQKNSGRTRLPNFN